MRLAVLGSLPPALVNAAWASAAAGVEVIYVAPKALPRTWTPQVVWRGDARDARLQRFAVGDSFDADAFLVIASREESLELVRRYKASMQGRPLLLAPGGFGIVESIDALLNTEGSPVSMLGQLPGFPVTGDLGTGTVHIRAVKRAFPVGALRQRDVDDLVATFGLWFSDLVVSSLAETTLSNINNVIHPPILLANAARSEAGESYLFYRQGLSTGASHTISGIDEERLRLLAVLGQDRVPLTTWLERYYGDQGLRGDTIQQMLAGLPTLAGSRGPETLRHRYVSEDITYGLAPIEELARRNDVPTPVLSSLITLFSTVCAKDLRIEAPRLVNESAVFVGTATRT